MVRYPPGTAGNPVRGGGLTQRSPRIATIKDNGYNGSKGRMKFGKGPSKSFNRGKKTRDRDTYYSIKDHIDGTSTSMGKHGMGMKMTESIYSDLKTGPITDRNSQYNNNELNSLMISIG